MRSHLKTTTLLLALALLAAPRGLLAQGVTTGAITGTITNPQGEPVVGAQVQIVSRSTGYSSGSLTRTNGLYLVQGLEVGGPYSVRVTSIGFESVERNDVYVTLSQATRIDFRMSERAVALAALEVTTSRTADFSPTRQGVSTFISDSTVARAPTLSRDFLDLVKMAPQVAKPQDGNGFSAGGQYNRFNSYTIDGANQQDRFNLNGSGSVPGGSAGAKLVSQDAVKEIRVSFTPSDVRQGNFTGMLVNAVTKNGTNDFHGGGSITYRNERLAARPLRASELDVRQFAFNLGGPIIQDRLHFFIAPEFQQRERPATGPYLGGTGAFDPRIAGDTLREITTIMQPLFDVGATNPVNLNNPLTNLFARIDFAINDRHRLVLRQIFNNAEDDDFSRNTTSFNSNPNSQNSGFRFGSNMYSRTSRNASTVLQLYSNLANGWQNELLAGVNLLKDERAIPVRTPEISVGINNGSAVATFGTEQFSPGNLLEQEIFEIVNNLTIPMGSHTLTLGGRFEHDNVFNNFAQRSFGVWVFPNLTALRNRAPSGYSYGYDNSGTGRGIAADFSVQMGSLYAQDQWAPTDRLTLTVGLRADMPRFVDDPLDNADLANAFSTLGVRTSDIPKAQVLFSPRLGFNYDVTGDNRNQVRGSLGIYTGAPPFILIGNSYANTGLGLVALVCTPAAGGVPIFTTDVNSMPRNCATQPVPTNGQAGTAGVNHTDPDFKYPQSLAASAGFDRQLPWATVLTVEAVYRKAINGVLIRDLNLRGPRLVNGAPYLDRNGRVLYADTISATHGVTNNNQRYITTYKGANFSEGLISVTNQSEDYNYTISGLLNKRFTNRFQASLGYTFMASKDLQSLTSDRAISNFRNGAQFAGAFEDLKPATSYFSRPHRIMAHGSYTLPTRTDISLYYEGTSGTPFTYVSNGDINGDLVTTNDPLYIPRNATDPNEIRIGTGTGAAFQLNAAEGQAFEDFLAQHDCLNDQRGQIMERNSCRSPFQHRMDLSIRQSLPAWRGQNVAIQLDVFNALNYLGKRFGQDWGQIELPTLSANFPQQAILAPTGRTAGPISQSMPNYLFNATAKRNGPFTKSTAASNFHQIQLTLRYSF
ncbi:MAG: carboxypeptidase regulatory-like domain-containing protein [Longimicrobiales bacterium]